MHMYSPLETMRQQLHDEALGGRLVGAARAIQRMDDPTLYLARLRGCKLTANSTHTLPIHMQCYPC